MLGLLCSQRIGMDSSPDQCDLMVWYQTWRGHLSNTSHLDGGETKSTSFPTFLVLPILGVRMWCLVLWQLSFDQESRSNQEHQDKLTQSSDVAESLNEPWNHSSSLTCETNRPLFQSFLVSDHSFSWNRSILSGILLWHLCFASRMHAPLGQWQSHFQSQWFQCSGSSFLPHTKSKLLWWLCEVVVGTGSFYLVALPSLGCCPTPSIKSKMTPHHVCIPEEGEEEEVGRAFPLKVTTQKSQHHLVIVPLVKTSSLGSRYEDSWEMRSLLCTAMCPAKTSALIMFEGKTWISGHEEQFLSQHHWWEL